MKKNGFTLIEILSIVVVLGIIALFAFPNISNNSKANKEKEYEKIVSTIESSARAYFSSNLSLKRVTLDTLKEEGLISNTLKNPITDTEIDGCVNVVNTNGVRSYHFALNCNDSINLTVDYNGGTSNQSFTSTYRTNDEIVLENPSKSGFAFKNWVVISGDSEINGNLLTIGTTDTTIYAVYDVITSLTVNLNGGTTTQTFNQTYLSGSTIVLENPTKSGYEFTGWGVTSGNSIISGNTLTIGTTATEITALFGADTYTITYDANGGSGAPASQSYTYAPSGTTNLSTTVPTRNNYEFLGWSLSSTATTASYTAGQAWNLSNANDYTLFAVWRTAILNSYSCANISSGSSPYVLTYTGNCTAIDDGDGNWRFKLLTSGTLTLTASQDIDVFLVGGGGAGGQGHYDDTQSSTCGGYNIGGPGGGGGYTRTVSNITLSANQNYTVDIGAGSTESAVNGSQTKFGSYTVNGGVSGPTSGYNYNNSSKNGGNGGSGGGRAGHWTTGGAGGSNGSNGAGTTSWPGGTGQGTTTREFGESTGDLYAGGGGGGGTPCHGEGGAGGAGGGGTGGNTNNVLNGTAGTANTGGGGGGAGGLWNGAKPGAGGSGIVVIRNHR